MKKCIPLVGVATVAILGVGAAVWAAVKVEPDKENVVASRLEGQWRLHGDLTERLTSQAASKTSLGMGFTFTTDPAVGDMVPERFEKLLKDKRVYLAGYMQRHELSAPKKERFPFLLVSHQGNPCLIYFRPKGDDPTGDAESMFVMLAVAKDRDKDLLFVGGDFNNQPFTAYERRAVAK